LKVKSDEFLKSQADSVEVRGNLESDMFIIKKIKTP